MLNPTGVTLAEYNDALAMETITHARVTFTVDNVVFQDEDLEQGGIRISTYMNPEESMEFGVAYCTEAVVKILRSDKTEMVNFAHEFTIEFGVEINGNVNWVTVGHFSGDKPVMDIASQTIELVAYDKMKRFDKEITDFMSLITFPCTIQNLYDELCEFLVLDNVAGDEIASVMNRQIANADDFEFKTCRELLSAIAEANGCYARMTNEGQVQLIWFSDHKSDMSLTLDNCFSGEAIKLEKSYSRKWGTLENTKWKDVESIQYAEYDNTNNPFEYTYIRLLMTDENNPKDVVQPSYDPYYNRRLWANVENFAWGSVENMKYKELEMQDDIAGGVYTITDNPFVNYGTDGEIKTHLQYILDNLYNFHLYYVANVSMVGNWLVEPGDIVLLEVSDGNLVEYPIFNRVLMWDGSCTCDYETTGSLSG